MIIMFFFGYFLMCLIFLVWRFFYHILSKEFSRDYLIKDFFNIYNYVKEIILSNPIKMKFIVILIAIFIILATLPVQIEDIDFVDDFLSAIIFFLMVTVFAPKENPANKKFPVEIFGFSHSVVLMYCSAGDLVIETFSTDNFFS